MDDIRIYYVPTEPTFKVEYGKAIELNHLVFVPLLSGFNFEYELLDLDLVERANGDYAVKVKIKKLS